MTDKNIFQLSVKKALAAALILFLVVAQVISWNTDAASKKVPAKVTITSIKAGGTNKITIKWKKAKNANKYRVYYRKSGSKKWIKVVDTKKLSYTQKSSKACPLKANTKYQYVIKAYNTKSRKWGKLSKTKIVRTAKAAVKKKATPTPKSKATATSKPKATATPKPTAAAKPKSTNTPTPTATPPAKQEQTGGNTSTDTPDTEKDKSEEKEENADSTTETITVTQKVKNVQGGRTAVSEFCCGGLYPDVNKLSYEITGDINSFSIDEEYKTSTYMSISVIGRKIGTIKVTIRYDGVDFREDIINCTSDDTDYLNYMAWRPTYIAKVKTYAKSNSLSLIEALKECMTADFDYAYGDDPRGAGSKYGAYIDMAGDCIALSDTFGDIATELGYTVKYVNVSGNAYDYVVAAASAYDRPAGSSNHIWNRVWVDNEWKDYDMTWIIKASKS